MRQIDLFFQQLILRKVKKIRSQNTGLPHYSPVFRSLKITILENQNTHFRLTLDCFFPTYFHFYLLTFSQIVKVLFQHSLFLRITILLSWLKSTLLLKNKCFGTTIYMKTQCLQTKWDAALLERKILEKQEVEYIGKE